METRIHKWALLILLGCILFGYFSRFGNSYVWDDHFQAKSSIHLQDIRYIGDLFKDHGVVFHPEDGASGYWRPLFFISFYVDHYLPIPKPVVHHFMATLIYLFACWGLYLFLCRFVASRLPALLAAMFFAFWPLHTDAVTFISGRHYPMVLGAWMLACIYYDRFLEEGRSSYLGISLLGYVLSLMTWDSAFVFPFLVLAQTYLLRPSAQLSSHRASIKQAATLYALVTIAYLGFRYLAMPFPEDWDPNMSFASALILAGSMALRCVLGALYPLKYTLTSEPLPIIEPLIDGVIGWLLVGVWLGTLAWFVRKRTRVGLALAWTFIPVFLLILPLPRPRLAYQDRFLFLPSVGLAMMVALVFEKVRHLPQRTHKLVMICFATICLGFVGTTLARNLDYRNDITLWCPEADTNPHVYDANLNCGQSLKIEGEFARARPYYERALAKKRPAKIVNDYATVIAQLGECERAIVIFRELRSKKPEMRAAWQNEAICLRLLGRKAEAGKLIAEMP